MNVLILYFSGTGNTKCAAEEFGERLRARGASVRLRSIEETAGSDWACDFLILGFPKYYECPVLYGLEYVKQNLPKAKKPTPCLAFCTQAGPLKTNFKGLERALARKNYRLTVEASFPYANNMAIFSFFKPTEPSALAENRKNIREQIDPMLDVFLNGGTQKEKTAAPYRGMVWLTAVLFTKLMPVFGMRYSADESCVSCGLCAKRCPTHNIRMADGKPAFGKDCLFCMRCINACPTNAILYNGKKRWQYRCTRLPQPEGKPVSGTGTYAAKR